MEKDVKPRQDRNEQEESSQPKRLLSTGKEVLFSQYSWAKPVITFLWNEYKGVKSGVAFFSFLAVCVAALSWYLTHLYENKKVEHLRVEFGNSNSFLHGRLEQVTEDIRRLERTIVDNKTDSNEAKRERDARISSLTNERDSVQQRLSYFEALPANLLSLYSNFVGLSQSQPTNFQHVVSLTQSLTNLVSTIDSARPHFELSLNGTRVNNGSVIPLPKTRTVFIQVKNVGTIAADKLTIALTGSLFDTNLIAPGWAIGGYANILGLERPLWHHIADKLTAPGNFFNGAPVELSTNYPHVVLPLQVEVYSIGSGKQAFNVFLHAQADGITNEVFTCAEPTRVFVLPTTNAAQLFLLFRLAQVPIPDTVRVTAMDTASLYVTPPGTVWGFKDNLVVGSYWHFNRDTVAFSINYVKDSGRTNLLVPTPQSGR